MIINAKGIRKSFGPLEVLKGIDFEVNKGEVLALVGPSGAGKTTLLNILSTLDHANSGTIELDGEVLNELRGEKLAEFRNKNIGIVFQFHNLFPEFTALENVCIPGMIAGRDREEVRDQANLLLTMLGLEHRRSHKPSELSGGEQQRVSVARSLINNPKVVFADEPSGNLDSQNATELHRLFFELRDKRGDTFVIVTHNRELAAMTDRTVTLKDGVIIGDEKNHG